MGPVFFYNLMKKIQCNVDACWTEYPSKALRCYVYLLDLIIWYQLSRSMYHVTSYNVFERQQLLATILPTSILTFGVLNKLNVHA